MSELWVVILAAGEGKRMRSARAKVLHGLAGRPLVSYPVALARAVQAAGIVVVVGHQGVEVQRALAGEPDLRFVEQSEQRGTGHALLVAKPAVPASATEIVLLYADVPLLERATVQTLLDRHRRARAAATVVTVLADDPTGYGRIQRTRGGRLRAIVEESDATSAQRRVREVNSGIYCFDPRALWPALDRLRPNNAQAELYLTDAVGLLVRGRRRVETLTVADSLEVAGVNDRRQLTQLERVLQGRLLTHLMADGVSILDPAATYVEASVAIGRDTVLYPGARLAGQTRLGEGCVIGTGSQLTDMTLGDHVTVRPYCVLNGSRVEAGATLGPFAYLRPGSVVGPDAKVGTFVEIKKSRLDRGAKVPHLAYVGDAMVGEEANLGAGTITCNYDGQRKHETQIGARAFVGTNSSLVAPVRIGDEAYVGAGSVITKDVPPGALAVGRAHQVTKEGWVARRRASETASPSAPGR